MPEGREEREGSTRAREKERKKKVIKITKNNKKINNKFFKNGGSLGYSFQEKVNKLTKNNISSSWQKKKERNSIKKKKKKRCLKECR